MPRWEEEAATACAVQNFHLALCAEGYAGPFCSGCSPGWFPAGAARCQPCEAATAVATRAAAGVLFALLIVFIGVYVWLTKRRITKKFKERDDREQAGPHPSARRGRGGSGIPEVSQQPLRGGRGARRRAARRGRAEEEQLSVGGPRAHAKGGQGCFCAGAGSSLPR